MNIGEMVEKYFIKDFVEANRSRMSEVLSHVKKFTKKINVAVREVSIATLNKKIKDDNYKIDCEIKLLDDGIELPFACSGFLEELKKYIPDTVEKVTLPTVMYNHLPDFFSKFKNLKALEFSDAGYFSPEELEEIYNLSNVTAIENSYPYYNNLPNDYYSLYANYIVVEGKYKSINLYFTDKNLDDATEVEMKTNNFNFDQLLEVLSTHKNIKKLEVNLPNSIRYIIEIEDKNIVLYINDNNPEVVRDLYESFAKNKHNLTKINFSIDSSEKSYYDIDYSKLDEISDKVYLEVAYTRIQNGPYEQFRTMIDGIKWYRNIINENDLSPVEKLTMAYDIMKSFQYKEVNIGEDINGSRYPWTIMETGNIVCVGYTSMLSELFKELDNNIKLGEFGVSCFDKNEKKRGYHSRSIARVDDDKYNIHGIYTLDATWDSIHKDGEETIDKDYDALSLYRYFLIPISEYNEVFKGDSSPSLIENGLELYNRGAIKEELETLSKSDDNDLSDVNKKILELFDKDITKKEIIEYLNARKIPFEEILSIVYNTRKAEGYSEEFLKEEMEKLKRINSKLEEENGKQV